MVGAVGNSANVRNAFEVHGPFLTLAQELLGDDNARLILTFEWQYIPYTYPQNYQHLPQFIVIGLPASEGSNALVLPAVGHELGHSLWRKYKLENDFKSKIEVEVNKAIKRKKKKFVSYYPLDQKTNDLSAKGKHGRDEAVEYGLLQLQEFFCDFVGLCIFGEAYLDSFDYLLSPSQSKERDPQYPSVKERARALSRNMAPIRLPPKRTFANRFATQTTPFDEWEPAHIHLILADVAAKAISNKAAKKAFSLCRARGIQPPKSSEAQRIRREFERGMPTEKATGLTAIVGAAWLAFKSKKFLPDAADQKRMAYLNELTMKSIEILELRGLIDNASKARRN